jgi:hypothetical protein
MFKLNAKEKDEIRKLTQQANRRIAAFLKVYEDGGYRVIPKEVSGGFNIEVREEFQTNKYALSRSTKFETEKEYKRHLNRLKRFDPDYQGPDRTPSVSEYTEIQKEKTFSAIKTAGIEIDEYNLQRLESMDIIELKKFWAEFTRRAVRMAAEYSSDQLFMAMMDEYSAVERQKEANEVIKNSAKG